MTVNLTNKFELFDDYWHPRIVGEVNDAHVKIAKFKGEFDWHSHEHEDELFLVVKGEITIHLRDKSITVGEGEFYIVPKGTEHKPVADGEAHVLMLEPKTTRNTGELTTEKTKENLEWI